MTQHASHDLKGSSDRFGYEWDVYAEILPEHEEQFRRWTAPLEPQDWQGKDFLDVGCGMGRNSYWPLKYGAAGGVAVDIDERSLESARRNLKPFPGMQVMRVSAYDLAFRIASTWPSRSASSITSNTRYGRSKGWCARGASVIGAGLRFGS
jgi:SAM-dependent methyltransferase